MRFERRPKAEGYVWTRRKLRAYLKRDERRRKKLDQDYPLLGAELLAGEALPVEPDLERAARDAANRASDQRLRDLDARHWRHGRAMYFACDPVTRAAIRRAWKAWRGPAKATMLIYVVEQHNGVSEARRKRYAAEQAAFVAKIRDAEDMQGNLNL